VSDKSHSVKLNMNGALANLARLHSAATLRRETAQRLADWADWADVGE
jgi:hypothetical protein